MKKFALDFITLLDYPGVPCSEPKNIFAFNPMTEVDCNFFFPIRLYLEALLYYGQTKLHITNLIKWLDGKMRPHCATIILIKT